MLGRCYRQGDLLVEAIATLPEGCAPWPVTERAGAKVHVLAEGETTGHAHCLAAGPDVSVLRPSDSSDPLTLGFVALKKLARLVHDEHRPLNLAPGFYRVIQQRRYEAATGAWRRVAD